MNLLRNSFKTFLMVEKVDFVHLIRVKNDTVLACTGGLNGFTA